MSANWQEYRKTATVQAIQINGPEDLPDDERIIKPTEVRRSFNGSPGDLPAWGVATLEGNHAAGWGDYLCEGTEGELWPVKQSIFEKTYEAVGGDEA